MGSRVRYPGASSATVCGTLGTYYVKTNTRKWLKENAGKKIINSQGKVEVLRGIAFIGTTTLGSSSYLINSVARIIDGVPMWSLYIIPPAYSFISNYVATRRRLSDGEKIKN